MTVSSSLLPFPDGWYFMARSDELPRGHILSRRFAGRDVVLHRGEGGLAVATDAHCPHLGAHFAHGGSVEGATLRCGMHGFCFDSRGKCVRTDYGTRPPPKAVLRTWPLLERDGLLFVWHSSAASDPTFDIPARGAAGFSSLRTRTWHIHGHPQETTENSVDLGHLGAVHGYRQVEMTAPVRTEGAHLTASFGFSRGGGIFGVLRDLRAYYTVHVHGLGYSFVEVSVPEYGLSTQQLVLARPTDPGEIDLTIAIRARPPEVTGRLSRLASRIPRGVLAEAVSALVLEGFERDVRKDFRFWENKRYVEHPALAEGDGPVMAYRRWARQFYGQPAPDTAGALLPAVA